MNFTARTAREVSFIKSLISGFLCTRQFVVNNLRKDISQKLQSGFSLIFCLFSQSLLYSYTHAELLCTCTVCILTTIHSNEPLANCSQ